MWYSYNKYHMEHDYNIYPMYHGDNTDHMEHGNHNDHMEHITFLQQQKPHGTATDISVTWKQISLYMATRISRVTQ